MADEGLESRLASHSAYFNSLVELVPAKYYLPDKDEEKSSKFHQNRSQKAPKQAIKEASKKAKRLRLDPKKHKTVLELQAEKERKEEESSEEEEEEAILNRNNSLNVEGSECTVNDLRSSLHSKIEQLRLKRKASNKKREGRPRKKTKLETKGKQKKDTANSSLRESKLQKEDRKVVNHKGEVVFSKFDFVSQPQEKGPRPGSKTHNYKKLLAQAEARKSKLEKMKASDAQTAKDVGEKYTWKTALLKAEGGKPKDDPKRLKKTIKRREKQKEKSKKQWKARTEQVIKQKEEKQKLRKQHLKERVEGKKGKKKSKGHKKGHKPGF